MLEILNIPDIRKRVAPITIERYHRMIELGMFEGWNVELLNGVLVEKMSKSALHVFLVDIIMEMLEEQCPKSEYWVRQELPITIENSEPEPDISVIAGNRAELRRSKPTSALFVIEVSISSLALDRSKANDYATAKIPEYWIVRPKAKKIEVYRTPSEGAYTEVIEMDASTTAESVQLPGFSFNLAEALAGFSDESAI